MLQKSLTTTNDTNFATAEKIRWCFYCHTDHSTDAFSYACKRYTGNSKCWWTHPLPEEPENLMGYQWWQSCLNRCYFRLLSCEQQNNHKRWLTFTYNFWFYCCYWFRQFPQQFAALYHMLYVEKDCLIFIRSYQMVAAFLISNFRNGGTYQ